MVSDGYRKYTFSSMFSPFVRSLSSFLLLLHHTIASGSENDLNYFELPIDVENSVNEIDGRPSGDETVGVDRIESNSIMEGHLTIHRIKEIRITNERAAVHFSALTREYYLISARKITCIHPVTRFRQQVICIQLLHLLLRSLLRIIHNAYYTGIVVLDFSLAILVPSVFKSVGLGLLSSISPASSKFYALLCSYLLQFFIFRQK